MKKALALFLAFISSIMFSLQASAAGAVPQTGDDGIWLYVVLAIVAVILIAVLIITGKKR